MPTLFDPINLGSLQLKNRIVMAPLTRSRAPNRVPNDMMTEYYSQRASFGLIITEATAVSEFGVGYPDTPGIWSARQVEGWKKVTDAVHAKEGKIFCQLWHVGRISDPYYLDGALPLAPSAIASGGHVTGIRPTKPFVVPKAMSLIEINDTINDFAIAAKNAKEAGFDGVEIHGANGYLLDQFLQDGSNKRTDEYGGSLENRLRFPLQVLDAVIPIWGSDRVGYHISPRCDIHSMGDSDVVGTFSALVGELQDRGVAFICSRESLKSDSISKLLRQVFKGIFIVNENFDLKMANIVIDTAAADMVAFGRLAIANPDLVARFKVGAALNSFDQSTFYTGGEKGYIDYPFLPSNN